MIEVESAEFQPPFSFRLATYLDLPSIAALFVEAFPAHPVSSLSSSLRHKFIAVHIDECAALLATDPATDGVIGFAIGGRYQQLDRARQAFIHTNVFPLALYALARRQTYFRGRDICLPGRAQRSRRASPAAGHELRYLAVSAAARGCGIGSALVRAMEDGMLIDQPYFAWVLAEHADAMRFYRRLGFREEYRSNGHARMIKGD